MCEWLKTEIENDTTTMSEADPTFTETNGFMSDRTTSIRASFRGARCSCSTFISLPLTEKRKHAHVNVQKSDTKRNHLHLRVLSQ